MEDGVHWYTGQPAALHSQDPMCDVATRFPLVFMELPGLVSTLWGVVSCLLPEKKGSLASHVVVTDGSDVGLEISSATVHDFMGAMCLQYTIH